MKLDTTKPGLHALFKPHHAALLQRLFEKTDKFTPSLGLGSGELWRWFTEHAKRIGLQTRSRASIIFALNDLAELGILKWVDATGKGGHQRRYSVKMSPDECESFIRVEITGKLDRIFYTDWSRIPP